jgi:molecular chaperone IbpA
MRNGLTLDNYFNDILRDSYRFAVGLEPTLRALDTLRNNTTNTGFPPYDLEQTGENNYRLSMAVAGYGPEDLEITEQNGLLTVIGKIQNEDQRTYLYKGIAGRSFRRSFYLDQYVHVASSQLINGILVIEFVKEVPESMKPRRIEIQTSPEVPALEQTTE